ncbi:nuclease-related domain-containing protein [Rossellomorea sp. YZS02]|uniref:nuclease-related domain-containing protein n=1 Tax=Rossellomorea sp. YZS02 TaxID=3097358 RepID=UPI002A15204E|nr:nuclease-related domain-containing protein [Rossellomorea sp. YZS02]MDX8345941.1 nuclease-related domain-containing protein [Rossellomorea sp. YZS02]
MICKELKIPIILEKTEALSVRIVKNHPRVPLIEKDLRKRRAGYNGESTIYYHLTFLRDKRYKIFYNVRLPIFSNHFQMDFLILTPFYILIIEVKNISGMVTIDPFIKQLTRTHKGVTEGVVDPVSQVQRYKLLIHKWFITHRIKHPPIEHLVVFSNPSTTLNYTVSPAPDDPYKQIIHPQNIIDKIKELNEKRPTPTVTEKELLKMKKLILKKHEEPEIDILTAYSLSKNDILTGVRCDNCQHIPMIRVSAAWYCPKCNNSSKTAHTKAIQEYFLLINNHLTNREIRNFLHLNSRNTAYKLLKSFHLQTQGSTKSVTYSKPTR